MSFKFLRLLMPILTMVFFIEKINAQAQNNIWYFGQEAGLDFNTNPPSPIQSQLTTLEGTASVCDPAGNLLFYTNGESIWDRNHNIMPNGNGLLGGESSAQAALIVPIPNSCTKYYVFTTEDHYTNGGLAYSIVDMCLNDGFGDIVQGSKNITLLDRSAEKITAVLHSNGSDIWILTHRLNSRDFYAYLITSVGLVSTPVITSIGSFYPTDAIIGAAKANHKGTRIVSVATFYGICDILDFDNTTGKLSNFIDLNQFFPGSHWFYGIEFSPDDNLLYLSTTYVTCHLYQVDLQTNLVTALNTKSGHYHYGALQFASDGKIYMARNNSAFLDVIQYPNVKGIGCMYDEAGVNLKSGTNSYLGLPNFVPYSFFQEANEALSLGPDTIICEGSFVEYSLPSNSDCTISFIWNDGTSSPTKIITQPGLYWVDITTDCIVSRDSVQIDFLPSTPVEIIKAICLGQEFEGYSSSGIYIDTFPSYNGCDSIRILNLIVNVNEKFIEVDICEGEFFEGYSIAGHYMDTLSGAQGACDTVRHLSLTTTPRALTNISLAICEGQSFSGYDTPGIYLDTFQTINGCDSIRILELAIGEQIYSEYSETICPGEVYEGYSIEGLYIDTLQSAFGCDSIRKLHLTILEAVMMYVSIQLCDRAAEGYTYPGIYVDTLISADGCDSIRVLEIYEGSKYIPNVFSPNNDGINDEFTIYISSDFLPGFKYFGLFDRFGDMVFETDSWPIKWDGTSSYGSVYQQGVFTYILIYECQGKNVYEHGNVTLVK